MLRILFMPTGRGGAGHMVRSELRMFLPRFRDRRNRTCADTTVLEGGRISQRPRAGFPARPEFPGACRDLPGGMDRLEILAAVAE